MLNYNFNDSMQYDFGVHDQKKKKNEGEEFKQPVPKKDRTIKIPKVFEFQFYDNFEELQALGKKIQTAQDNYKIVSEEDKERFRELAATGFFDWTLKEYQAFIKGIRKHHFADIESIAREVETKTSEEVEEYLKVFMVRYRELREKDVVMAKLQKQDFEDRNIETIRNFTKDKQESYAILLQENNFFNRNSYLTLIERAHNKMVHGTEDSKKEKDLQLKIDHFFHSQSQKMVQEQLKYICMAVRAEECLRGHLAFQSERKNMRAVIQRSHTFNKGFKEGIHAQDQKMN